MAEKCLQRGGALPEVRTCCSGAVHGAKNIGQIATIPTDGSRSIKELPQTAESAGVSATATRGARTVAQLASIESRAQANFVARRRQSTSRHG